jgi:hypothetical protein
MRASPSPPVKKTVEGEGESAACAAIVSLQVAAAAYQMLRAVVSGV